MKNRLEKKIVIGAKHPQAGFLYLSCIPDSEVGLYDIYELTDSCHGLFLEIKNTDWRQHPPTFDGQPWDRWVISDFLSRIRWDESKEIERICRKSGLSSVALWLWAKDVSRWKDIPVTIEIDDDGHQLIKEKKCETPD
ncbi:hypothetical protein [Serratia symbiotica]|uniref:hypothetical protein n=1 Tax=Serratia symbiotica TaxID=138074 RepID=UPI001CF01E23|nr:hypothetical protein [Serratia symbiotica]